MREREPILRLHPSIVALLGAILGVYVFLNILHAYDLNTFLWLRELMVFTPARYNDAGLTVAGGVIAKITSFLSYALVQSGIEHLAINLLFLTAIGSAIVNRMGGANFLYYSAICAIGGALMHLVFYWEKGYMLVGASAIASGYVAGFILLFISARKNGQAHLLSQHPREISLMSPMEAIRDRTVLTIVIAWSVLNYVMAQAWFDSSGSTIVAWEAHLGGFIAGLVFFWTFDYRNDEPIPQ